MGDDDELEEPAEVAKEGKVKHAKVSVALLLMLLIGFCVLVLFGNYRFTTVVSGSMEPTIKTYSLSLVEACTIDDVEVGDIVMYRFLGKTIAHRVIDVQESVSGKTLITKGDNNENPDNVAVTSDMVTAKIVKTFNWTAPIIRLYLTVDGEKVSVNWARMIIITALIGLVLSVVVDLICKVADILVKQVHSEKEGRKKRNED